MRQRGLLRSLRASELSDGTLRYIMLCAALLAPSKPEILILNEPAGEGLRRDILAQRRGSLRPMGLAFTLSVD